MKILFLSHYFPPEVNAPASRTYEHCKRWVEAGHDVTVLTCAPNCPHGVVYEGYQNRLRRKVEDVDGIRVIRVWTFLAANAGTSRRIANYLSYMFSAVWASLRLQRPDVVIATSPQFFCGWAGILVSRLKRRPLVLEIRDIWPESIEAVGAMRNRGLLRVLEFLERKMYAAASHIVTVGNGYRDRIAGKLSQPRTVSVITNGVDVKLFQQTDDERFRHVWGLEGCFVCSYIGTIGMAHGLDVVLRAAKQLKEKGRSDIRFCLVGDGADRKRLEEQCRQDDLGEIVIFTGRQPRGEVPSILSASNACLIHLKGCDLFNSVIPSKIFETMAMGRAIIMGVRGEAQDIVMQAGAAIEMKPDSGASLVAAVERLVDDVPFRHSLEAAGRDAVEEKYTRDQLAEAYLALLHRVAGVDSEPYDIQSPSPSLVKHTKTVSSR